ncbi:MAG TPA: transporter substrate-binding domain-containing protein, partial [Anaerolineales bacterium]|nr:transporter substrate-binding domain-containing protein [Anaerolineales bacterium]
MKRSIAIFIIAGFALTACFPSHDAPTVVPDDQLAEIQARGTLIIATDADYVPQSRLILGVPSDPATKCESSQYTANQFTGFDVEVGVEIAQRLGVEPCFVTPPWSQLVAGKWGNNWDIHVGSVAITDERL